MWSTVTDTGIGPQFSPNPGAGTTVSGTLPKALFGVYTVTNSNLTTPGSYIPGNISALNSAISSSVAVALSVVPLASPASAIIKKKDSVTGGYLDAPATLGPIFTQRAETVGKGQFYIGIAHQDFHFTSINGQNLNGISMLDTSANRAAVNQAVSGLVTQGGPAPATYHLATDVRLSQDIAFFTAGVTDRIEVSLGLPTVHASVASTAYDATVFGGAGNGSQQGNCWCINTLSPGTFVLTHPGIINQAGLAKTGFGDLLIRTKGEVISTKDVVFSVGGDIRFPTGDASNYLGTGATSVKPFVAMSYYKHTSSNFVFSPHFDVGWQISGKSILGGQLNGSPQTATLSDGSKFQYLGAPLLATKDFIPDVLAWSVGAEWAVGNRNTIVTDMLGNQIGWVHGAQQLTSAQASGLSPADFSSATAAGMVPVNGKTSFGQYFGSFGYKAALVGKLVASFNLLVRLDHNGLTSRLSPSYGLSYTF